MEKNSILLVDDDPNVLKSTRQFLKEFYTVYAVSNGRDAIEFFKRKRADLVLIDYIMPEMSGFETLQAIRKLPEALDVPVIYLLTDRTAEGEILGLELGSVDYIRKPFAMDALLKRINQRIMELRLSKHVEIDETPQALQLDRMTGLLNRESFEQSVNRILNSGQSGALLSINLDEFKYVNDRYGLMEGDNLLIHFARLLKESVGDTVLLSRLGGDEFALFNAGTTDRVALSKLVEQMLHNFQQNLFVPDKSRVLTASIGISLFPDHATVYEDLFDHAGKALLYVKNHGKNGYRFYDSIDDRQEESKGRHYCTFTQQRLLLKQRNGEERQIWVKFGEYRLIWHGFRALKRIQNITYVSVLFTIRAREDAVLENAEFEAIGTDLSAYFRKLQIPGIFTWYSVNQMLMLCMYPDTLEQILDHFREDFISVAASDADIQTEFFSSDELY